MSVKKFISVLLGAINMLLFIIPANAGGPYPILLTVNNTTSSNYQVVACRDTQYSHTMEGDYSPVTYKLGTLPETKIISAQSTFTFYTHIETDNLTVRLFPENFQLSYSDTDCSITGATYSGVYPVNSNDTLSLTLVEDGLSKNQDYGTLNIRNTTQDSKYLLFCDMITSSTISIENDFLAPGAVSSYNLTRPVKVYINDGGNYSDRFCSQSDPEVIQIIYYYPQYGNTTTRSIVDVSPVRPVESQSSIEVDPGNSTKITTPQGRQFNVYLNGDYQEPPADEAILIRTGGADN